MVLPLKLGCMRQGSVRLSKIHTQAEALANTELIERRWLTKLLYKSIEKVIKLSESQVDRIVIEYPVVSILYDYFLDIKQAASLDSKINLDIEVSDMRIHDFLIHTHTEESYHISADEKLYWLIANDMIDNAGDFTPRLVWQCLHDPKVYSKGSIKDNSDERYKETELSSREKKESLEATLNTYNRLDYLLDAWVGSTGMRTTIDEVQIKKMRSYLSTFDNCRFFDALYSSDGYKMISDFQTVKEITILNTELLHKNNASFLEIGGGYGRLAEALFNVFDSQIQYVMADSVPISLMYCYLYLQRALPSKKIGIYYLDKGNPKSYDIYIVPTWRLEEVCANDNYDVLINIQSMQEMSQFHVDYYLNFFDKHSKDDSIFYLNNNKKYIFKGVWNYPSDWRLNFRHNTPWSWSDDCPVEIFSKGDIDFHRKNLIINSIYLKSIEDATRLREFEKEQKQNEIMINLLQKELQIIQDNLHQTKQKMQQTQNELQQSCEKIQALNENISYLNTEIQQLKSTVSWKITKPLRWVKKLMKAI